jgi:hypothetical protein
MTIKVDFGVAFDIDGKPGQSSQKTTSERWRASGARSQKLLLPYKAI